MTNNQKAEIAKHRNPRLGYKAISKRLNIPVNTIKNCCRTCALRAKDVAHIAERLPIYGTPIILTKIMDRPVTWDELDVRVICPCCGKVFAPKKPDEKYCSHSYYVKSHFHGGSDD